MVVTICLMRSNEWKLELPQSSCSSDVRLCAQDVHHHELVRMEEASSRKVWISIATSGANPRKLNANPGMSSNEGA